MTESDQKPRERFPLFLAVACTALAVLSVLLTVQNMSLKSKLATAVAASNAPPPGALKAGDTLEAFDVLDATGQATHLEFGGPKKTLLLVFSSTCGACRETIPVWNRILADTPSIAVNVVGIQTDFEPTAGSGESTTLPVPDLRFPVFGFATPQGEPLSKFPLIPAAALVDAAGAVQAVWFGTPSKAQTSELRRALAG
jgi:hypothetical protein